MTSPQPLLTAESLRVWLYPSVKLLEFSWSGYVPSDRWRELHDQNLALSEQYGVQLWLNDYADLRAVRRADQEWLFYNFARQVLARSPLRRSAVVYPRDTMAMFFVDSVMRERAPRAEWAIRVFPSRQLAFEWLTADHLALPDAPPTVTDGQPL